MNNHKDFIIEKILSAEQKKINETHMDYYERLSKLALKLDAVTFTPENTDLDDSQQ